MSSLWNAVAALVPSIGVGVLFYLAMRFIIRADRSERANLALLDEQNAVPVTPHPVSTSSPQDQ